MLTEYASDALDDAGLAELCHFPAQMAQQRHKHSYLVYLDTVSRV